jgi:hypothetical protein
LGEKSPNLLTLMAFKDLMAEPTDIIADCLKIQIIFSKRYTAPMGKKFLSALNRLTQHKECFVFLL